MASETYGPWTAGGKHYRVANGRLEVFQRYHNFPGEWVAATETGGPAAALELQRLAREREAALEEGRRSGLLAAAVLAERRGREYTGQVTPGAVLRDLAAELEVLAKGGEREAPSRAEAEVARLTTWLHKIEGGDSPCGDESQLRQWAYEALTLGREASDG